MKREETLQVEGSGGEDGVPLHVLVSRGREMLNRHRLAEAEEQFHRALEASSASIQDDRIQTHLLNSLLGLVEVYIKRGRATTKNELERQRMYMHAISSSRKATSCCENALEWVSDNQRTSWFTDQQSKTENKLRMLEDTLVESMQDKVLKKDAATEKDAQPESIFDVDKVLDLSWIQELRSYYKDKCATYWFLRYESKDDLRLVGMEEEEQIPEPEPEPEPEEKKIDFDKMSKCIQKIVQRLQQTGHKIHPKMTPEQKLNLVSPMHSDFDIYNQFSKILNGEQVDIDKDEGVMSPVIELENLDLEVDKDMIEKIQDRDEEVEKLTQSNLGSVSNAFCSTDNLTKLNQYNEDTANYPIVLPTLPEAASQPCYYDRHTRDDNLFKHGIITIWRTSKRVDSPDITLPIAPHQLQMYEEVSPLTDMIGFTFPEKSESDEKEALQQRIPISEKSLNLTLVFTLYKLGERLKADKKLAEASKVFKFALGILQECASDVKAVIIPMADILHVLSQIKCAQGDVVGGAQLMEECLGLLEKSDVPDKRLKMAQAWFDLGSAYIAEYFRQHQLFEHVMGIVKESLQIEVKSDDVEVTGDDDSDDDDSSEGESYSVCTQEALVCFGNALEILRDITNMASDVKYNTLLVDTLTRFGDCCIMASNYETATRHYEEAVGLFKNIVGSVTLADNAHVLSMLGTANFLLSNFPKAIAMYKCANLLQQHLYSIDEPQYEVAFTLAMIALSYHCMGHYDRCIAWCLRAFEMYSHLYKENILKIQSLQRWFVAETLYMLGFSYGTLAFHEKSLYYLRLSRNMLLGVADADVKQSVRILKAIADEHLAQEDNENALKFYNEALEMSSKLGNEKNTTALQNKLLNRIAGVHVSTKQYTTAATYLRQALDCQKNIQNSIKDDMVEMLRQLIQTYTLAGDVDRALECCTECVEAYNEMPDSTLGAAEVLGSMGTLYHVKACLQEDNEEMLHLLSLAENHYEDAMMTEPHSNASIQYANYLYQQGQYADALLTMMPVVHLNLNQPHAAQLKFCGVEQAVLPEHIQADIEDIDDLAINSKIYAKFLAVLCYKQMNLTSDADECLVDLVTMVTTSKEPLNHSILGYALFEMNVYVEAAISFARAAWMEHDNWLAVTNYWICVILHALSLLSVSLCNIFEYLYKDHLSELMVKELAWQNDDTLLCSRYNMRPIKSIRDSGYYDHALMQRSLQEESHESLMSPHSVQNLSLQKDEIDYNLSWQPQNRLIRQTSQGEREVWLTSDPVDASTAIRHALSSSELAGNISSARVAKFGLAANQSPESPQPNREEVQSPSTILTMLQKQQEEAIMREKLLFPDLLNRSEAQPCDSPTGNDPFRYTFQRKMANESNQLSSSIYDNLYNVSVEKPNNEEPQDALNQSMYDNTGTMNNKYSPQEKYASELNRPGAHGYTGRYTAQFASDSKPGRGESPTKVHSVDKNILFSKEYQSPLHPSHSREDISSSQLYPDSGGSEWASNEQIPEETPLPNQYGSHEYLSEQLLTSTTAQDILNKIRKQNAERRSQSPFYGRNESPMEEHEEMREKTDPYDRRSYKRDETFHSSQESLPRSDNRFAGRDNRYGVGLSPNSERWRQSDSMLSTNKSLYDDSKTGGEDVTYGRDHSNHGRWQGMADLRSSQSMDRESSEKGREERDDVLNRGRMRRDDGGLSGREFVNENRQNRQSEQGLHYRPGSVESLPSEIRQRDQYASRRDNLYYRPSSMEQLPEEGFTPSREHAPKIESQFSSMRSLNREDDGSTRKENVRRSVDNLLRREGAHPSSSTESLSRRETDPPAQQAADSRSSYLVREDLKGQDELDANRTNPRYGRGFTSPRYTPMEDKSPAFTRDNTGWDNKQNEVRDDTVEEKSPVVNDILNSIRARRLGQKESTPEQPTAPAFSRDAFNRGSSHQRQEEQHFVGDQVRVESPTARVQFSEQNAESPQRSTGVNRTESPNVARNLLNSIRSRHTEIQSEIKESLFDQNRNESSNIPDGEPGQHFHGGMHHPYGHRDDSRSQNVNQPFGYEETRTESSEQDQYQSPQSHSTPVRISSRIDNRNISSPPPAERIFGTTSPIKQHDISNDSVHGSNTSLSSSPSGLDMSWRAKWERRRAEQQKRKDAEDAERLKSTPAEEPPKRQEPEISQEQPTPRKTWREEMEERLSANRTFQGDLSYGGYEEVLAKKRESEKLSEGDQARQTWDPPPTEPTRVSFASPGRTTTGFDTSSGRHHTSFQQGTGSVPGQSSPMEVSPDTETAPQNHPAAWTRRPDRPTSFTTNLRSNIDNRMQKQPEIWVTQEDTARTPSTYNTTKNNNIEQQFPDRVHNMGHHEESSRFTGNYSSHASDNNGNVSSHFSNEPQETLPKEQSRYPYYTSSSRYSDTSPRYQDPLYRERSSYQGFQPSRPYRR